MSMAWVQTNGDIGASTALTCLPKVAVVEWSVEQVID